MSGSRYPALGPALLPADDPAMRGQLAWRRRGLTILGA